MSGDMNGAPRFLPDSSCIVPTLLARHPHHGPARHELDQRLERGERMVAAAHALAESYSVLTRMPRPNRLSPTEARRLLRTGFLDRAELAALEASAYEALLVQAPVHGIAGGRIYDAVIAACAAQARVDVVVTFNERHFRPLLPSHVRIVVPSA
jgi:predicted nucleic acid-binding protein